MPFDKPDLLTLRNRITNDLNSRFSGTNNPLRRKVTTVIAMVLAGLAWGLYGFLDWISKQVLPDTMDDDKLLRYGAILGVPFINASRASGTITVTGTNGSVIPSGTIWQRVDGLEYIVSTDATISSGSAAVSVDASDYGAAYNTDAGTAISLISPISGVVPDAVVAVGGITGGSDAMDIETYRSRVLSRTATFYTGANAAIYKKWALEVPDVTRAWVYENTPVDGTVSVLFVCDDQPGSIIPSAGKITDVDDYLSEHTDPTTGQLVGRGVNVTLAVGAPVAQAVNFTILPVPDTPAVRSEITAELTDLLRREAEPGGDILISHIRAAIANTAGVNDFTLVTPNSNVSVSSGYIAVLGTITWAV